MPDIFLSYNRDDQARAKLFAEAFEREGFKVWWDVGLKTGEAYDEVTETALRTAKAVVVLWSKKSVASRWVRAEATLADRNKTLVPCMIEPCERPIMFELTQSAELSHWQGDQSDRAWQAFLGDVKQFVGQDNRPARPAETTPPPVAAPMPTTPTTFSIGLAPFADSAGGASGDDFTKGLVAEIAAALTRFPVLRVVDAGPASAGRYLLEGNVRRSGQSLRINIQLRDAVRGEMVWAERFDSGLDDPFALQDDVANKAAGRIESAILAHETYRIAARPVESLSAHELWLRTRETIRRAGFDQMTEIEALSERAVALEPGHAGSLALLATVQGFRIALAGAGAGADVEVLQTRIAQIADRAMLTGAEDPEVLCFIAEAHLLSNRDMVVARALADRAVQMNPGMSVGWDISGNIRMQSGEYETAFAHYERCMELDPKSPWRTYVWPSMAGCLVTMGRFDEAIVFAKEGMQISPGNPWGAACLIAALAHSGRIDEARAALARFDPRQAGVFETSSFGPRLSALIGEALVVAGGAPRMPEPAPHD